MRQYAVLLLLVIMAVFIQLFLFIVEPFNEADDTNYNENGEVFVKEEVDMEPSEHDAN